MRELPSRNPKRCNSLGSNDSVSIFAYGGVAAGTTETRPEASRAKMITSANEEVADQIAELETEKDVLTQTLKSALDSVDELIDASEAQQTYMETC